MTFIAFNVIGFFRRYYSLYDVWKGDSGHDTNGRKFSSRICILYFFLFTQGDCQCSEGHLQPNSAFPVITQLFLGKNAAFSHSHFSIQGNKTAI